MSIEVTPIKKPVVITTEQLRKAKDDPRLDFAAIKLKKEQKQ